MNLWSSKEVCISNGGDAGRESRDTIWGSITIGRHAVRREGDLVTRCEAPRLRMGHLRMNTAEQASVNIRGVKERDEMRRKLNNNVIATNNDRI